MERPLVSVIITSYNYGHYLDDAIESVLKQTYPNIEIIVVDDGSTDNTKDIAKSYPVTYIYQKNQGVAKARNTGIKRSTGDFFLCLDADDKISPQYIQQAVQTMLENPKVGYVITGSKLWHEELKIENIWTPQRMYNKHSFHTGWKGFPGCALFRRKAFDSLDYGYDSSLPAMEDMDVCLRVLEKWQTKTLFEPLHWYRSHKGSLDPETSQGRKVAEAAICNKYRFRKPYRRVTALYKNTFGRAASLMRHPFEYLKGINRKVKLNSWMKSHTWVNPTKKEEAKELIKEINWTTDMIIDLRNNHQLKDYYLERLCFFEDKLLKIINSDVVSATRKISVSQQFLN